MTTYGNMEHNSDGTKNMSVGFIKEDGANTTSGSIFQNDYKQHNDMRGETFSSRGGSLGFHHDGNPTTAGSLTVQQVHPGLKQASATASIGVGSPTHRVAVETFATHTMPKASQNFTTVGAKVDAQMGRVGGHAAIAHTPRFNQTEQSLGARVNLHQSPTSSLNLGVGSSRVVTPSQTTPWNHGLMFSAQKKF